MLFFFFNDTATTEIYTLSLHDALPIYPTAGGVVTASLTHSSRLVGSDTLYEFNRGQLEVSRRSEEHTSELQSQSNLVCRLLLEKKKRLIRLPRHYPRAPTTHHQSPVRN